ncbi:hypothetical protein GCM10011504_31690 [Siccirubricoccus deserti]|nr:hypothetical protein GCM10011504_31690 [Siccirubricoccus deserti]
MVRRIRTGVAPAGRLPPPWTRGIRPAGGFDFDPAAEVALTPPPSPAELAWEWPAAGMPATTPEVRARPSGRATLARTAAE